MIDEIERERESCFFIYVIYFKLLFILKEILKVYSFILYVVFGNWCF